MQCPGNELSHFSRAKYWTPPPPLLPTFIDGLQTKEAITSMNEEQIHL